MTKRKDRRAAGGSNDKFNRRQVLDRLKRNVYPPCKKKPEDIRVDDRLEADLGKTGRSKSAVCSRSNRVFSLSPPNDFSISEVKELKTVSDHLDATCDKLKAVGRFLEGDRA